MRFILLAALIFAAEGFTFTGVAPDSGSKWRGGPGVKLRVDTPLVCHLQWIGPRFGMVTLPPVKPRAPVSFTYALPPGSYTLRVWFTDGVVSGWDKLYRFTVAVPAFRRATSGASSTALAASPVVRAIGAAHDPHAWLAQRRRR